MRGLAAAFIAMLLAGILSAPASGAKTAKIRPARSIAVGGFDPVSLENLPALLEQLDDALPKMKAAGATSHEGYIRWRLIEPEAQGKFDFRVYDSIVEKYKKHGMKWVPFLIIGSPYSLPDWYYKSKQKQGYVCLEHGQESDVQSLWNPALRPHVERVMKAFAAHYAKTGVIESVLLGVTGNYGEAIYPASGNDWTSSVHGEYHTHHGYWAADPYAQASFRKWLKDKYRTPAALNKSWKSDFKSFASIKPSSKDKMPSARAWHDMIQWYSGSMNEYTDFWVKTARKYFPGIPVYICTGGDANPMHGSDFSEQARIAAKHNAGVRITNEASDYALNFSITRWVASASNFYGGYFGFEPAGHVDERGVVARIYNAAASAAGQLHTYWGNVFDTPERKAAWDKNLALFPQKEPVIDIALYYSKPSIAIQQPDFYGPARELRDYFDYDIIDDSMIDEGALNRHKLLVWPAGSIAGQKTFNILAKWISSGGTLVLYSASGPLREIGGAAPANWPPQLAPAADSVFTDAAKSFSLLGQNAKKAPQKLMLSYGKGRLILMPAPSSADVFIRKSPAARFFKMLTAGDFGPPLVLRQAIDFEWDSVYLTVIDNGKRLMALSQAKTPKTAKAIVNGKPIDVKTEPDTIVFVDLK